MPIIRKTRWVKSPEEKAQRRAENARLKAELLASLSPEDASAMEQWLGPCWRDCVLADLEATIARIGLAMKYPFWRGKSFEELVTEQGVYPIDDIGKLAGDWPEDADFDSFLNAVRSARS